MVGKLSVAPWLPPNHWIAIKQPAASAIASIRQLPTGRPAGLAAGPTPAEGSDGPPGQRGSGEIPCEFPRNRQENP